MTRRVRTRLGALRPGDMLVCPRSGSAERVTVVGVLRPNGWVTVSAGGHEHNGRYATPVDLVVD